MTGISNMFVKKYIWGINYVTNVLLGAYPISVAVSGNPRIRPLLNDA
jgi:hypothetical protein